MRKNIKSRVRRMFPSTLICKAWLNAWKDCLFSRRESFAQVGEDLLLLDLLRKYQITNGRYIDVGANHPTKLSNTYRLYREGFTGITIEPNRGLLRLHRMIRPKDLQLAIGCGETAAVLSFQHAASHVLSGFQSDGLKTSDILRTELIPVLPLDLITASFPDEEFVVLSIDVEGYDLQVVLGARETLKRTWFVVIERGDTDGMMTAAMAQENFFPAAQTSHNFIFMNERMKKIQHPSEHDA